MGQGGRECGISSKSSFEGDTQNVALGTTGLVMKPVPTAQSRPVNPHGLAGSRGGLVKVTWWLGGITLMGLRHYT